MGGGKLESSVLEDAKKVLAERKCGLHHYQLAEEGQDLERVYAPIGLNLGSTNPQEIAVAILAEGKACRQKNGIKNRIVKTWSVN